MNWLMLLLPFSVAVTTLLLPGMVVGHLIGLRGLWAAALAPAISTTLLVLSAFVLPLAGLQWQPLNAYLGAAVFALAVVLLYRVVLRRTFDSSVEPPRGASRWGTQVAWVIGAALVVGLFCAGLGGPENFSQTYDNIFHLNLVRFIAESGNASALAAGHMVSVSDGIAFYPNAWHTLVSLVQMVTQSSIPLSINGFNLAVLVTVWVPGALLFVRQFVALSSPVAIGVGFLVAAFPAMPLNLLSYGVLYPFFFGLAFVPGLLAVLCQLLRVSFDSKIGNHIASLVLVLGMIPAVAVSHPGAFMAALALSVPIVIVATLSGFAGAARRDKVLRLAGLGAYGLVGLLLLVKVRTSFDSTWAPPTTFGQGIWQTFSLGLLGIGLPIVLGLFVLFGIFRALRSKKPVFIALSMLWAVGALLFMTATWMPFWRLRVFLIGAWYADTPRLAAIFVIALLPLAAYGISEMFKLFPRNQAGSNSIRRIVAVAIGAIMVVSAGWPTFLKEMRFTYEISDNSPLITSDELRLLERLPDLVPEGGTVLGSPWTGAGLAYALGHRDVVYPHIGASVTEDELVVIGGFRWAANRPGVCEAIKSSDIFYALDFGLQEVHGGRHEFWGFEDLEDSDSVELVAQEGEAKLYRVSVCD